MKKPNHVFLRRLRFWVMLGVFILCLLGGLAYYFGIKILQQDLMVLSAEKYTTFQGQAMVEIMRWELYQSLWFILPAFFLAIFILGLILRWILGRSFKKHVPALADTYGKISKKSAKPDKVKEKIIYKVDKNKETLLYTHMLASFQREGQWVDFLNENLDLYEDAQIGTAVRNIKENCKKVLDSHFRLKPVLNQDQGETVTLENGFAPDTIKLVGNVQGSPPFKGIVRHKGWKIQKVDIPDFSGEQNLEVLTPAEVEII